MTPSWTEVGRHVYVLRYPVLDVNTTLVLGDGAALVVDTLGSADQAGELLAAVRRVTNAPWRVVNTHHHLDHVAGNDVLGRDREIWAHEAAAEELVDAAGVRTPTRTVHDRVMLTVGGRRVELRHPGRGHTAGDLVVVVPDADIMLAGDLIEQSGPPQFHDAYPLEWPHTVTELLALVTGAVVPGHGAVVDAAFVRGQHDALAALAWLIRDGHADGAPAAAVAERAPFDTATALVAVERGYAELDGKL